LFYQSPVLDIVGVYTVKVNKSEAEMKPSRAKAHHII